MNQKIPCLSVALCLLLIACSSPSMTEQATTTLPSAPEEAPSDPTVLSPAREVMLRTKEGVNIAATYYPANGKGVLLLHILNSDRRAWASFAEKLQEEGYAILAIDLRGHGDSDLDWRDFVETEQDSDFLDMLLDVQAAEDYLNEQGKFATIIIGASIGANLAVLHAEKDPRVEHLVLLSPGMNYRGIALPSGPLYAGKVLLVATSEDEYSTEAVETYARRIRGEYKTIMYTGDAHGTELLEQEPELAQRISAWLRR